MTSPSERPQRTRDRQLELFRRASKTLPGGANSNFRAWGEDTIYIDRGRYELIPERKSKLKASEWILNEGLPRGADFYPQPDGELLHLTNWVECVRSRKKPTAPAEAGVLAAASAQLANQALRSGQMAHWGKK